jgi:excisionase family DNA binding protein
MDLITKTDEICVSFLKRIEETDSAVSGILGNYRPALNGERYLTDRELSKTLNISRRTLQDYRTEGKIPYYLVGGKILYRESDIEKILMNNYHPQSDEY